MKKGGLLQPVIFKKDKVLILDQRALPFEEVYIECTDIHLLMDAILSLAVRGAPLLGLAGIGGLYLSALKSKNLQEFSLWVDKIIHLRPTALQLSSAVLDCYHQFGHLSLQDQAEAYFNHAQEYSSSMIALSQQIAEYGQSILPSPSGVLTHCNTGSLAMGGEGTALGIITFGAIRHNKKLRVFFTETRPLQQGLRLTAYELEKHQIESSCIVDSACSYCMQKGWVDLVITGADRIAVNGDTANKIGTCTIALAAHHYGIPFYVAAPTSTIDFNAANGESFEIELRDSEEILPRNPFRHIRGINPAFDLTPESMITAIITEKGVFRPPFHFLHK